MIRPTKQNRETACRGIACDEQIATRHDARTDDAFAVFLGDAGLYLASGAAWGLLGEKKGSEDGLHGGHIIIGM